MFNHEAQPFHGLILSALIDSSEAASQGPARCWPGGAPLFVFSCTYYLFSNELPFVFYFCSIATIPACCNAGYALGGCHDVIAVVRA